MSRAPAGRVRCEPDSLDCHDEAQGASLTDVVVRLVPHSLLLLFPKRRQDFAKLMMLLLDKAYDIESAVILRGTWLYEFGRHCSG